MAGGLVRVRLNGVEKNVGAAFAAAHGLVVLDEPTTNRDGSLRRTTRAGGRPVKPKTSVAKKAAEKRSRPLYQPVIASPVPAGEVSITAAVSESADDSEES